MSYVRCSFPPAQKQLTLIAYSQYCAFEWLAFHVACVVIGGHREHWWAYADGKSRVD
jgi:hypothetical protein